MFTRCPACQTLFRVRPETLRIAHGQVRCGRCDAQFNALETLAEDAEALVEPVAAPDAAESPVVSEAAGAVGPSQPAPVGAEAAGEATGAAPERSPPTALSPDTIQELLLNEEPVAQGRGRRWAWGVLAWVLLMLLAGQWAYLQRAHLYGYSALRPILQAVCARLECDLPLTRAPERIEVIERLVRDHPRVANALLVEATFVSRAEEPIAYPVLELQLADVSGNRVAARRFTPKEYLPADADIEHGLAPDRPVQISLELVAPRTEVVSFQFDFF